MSNLRVIEWCFTLWSHCAFPNRFNWRCMLCWILLGGSHYLLQWNLLQCYSVYILLLEGLLPLWGCLLLVNLRNVFLFVKASHYNTFSHSVSSCTPHCDVQGNCTAFQMAPTNIFSPLHLKVFKSSFTTWRHIQVLYYQWNVIAMA